MSVNRLNRLYKTLPKVNTDLFKKGETVLPIKKGFCLVNRDGKVLKVLSLREFTIKGSLGYKVNNDELLLDLIFNDLKNY